MTVAKDFRLGAKRGLLTILKYAEPKYDVGRHLMVVAKCRCGVVRSYRLDNIFGTPRPCCPTCAAKKMLGNRYHLRRKRKKTGKSNGTYPIEIQVLPEVSTAAVATPDPIRESRLERAGPANRCIHGFHLTDEEIAEGLQVARTRCIACLQTPLEPKAALEHVSRQWSVILKKANLSTNRGKSLTDLETEPTAKRKSTHDPDAADLGRTEKNLIITDSPLEIVDAARQRDQELGGKKRTAAGRSGARKINSKSDDPIEQLGGWKDNPRGPDAFHRDVTEDQADNESSPNEQDFEPDIEPEEEL
jgi:hypothetical protein